MGGCGKWIRETSMNSFMTCGIKAEPLSFSIRRDTYACWANFFLRVFTTDEESGIFSGAANI